MNKKRSNLDLSISSQLEPQFTVFQYGIKLNNVIQVLVKNSDQATSDAIRRSSCSSLDTESQKSEDEHFNDDSNSATASESEGEVIGQVSNFDHQQSPSTQSNSSDDHWIECDKCLDNPQVTCKNCSCCICGGKNDPDKQIICDECNLVYHLWCHEKSPLQQLPPENEDWYCFQCKNLDGNLIKEKELAYLTKVKVKSATNKRPSDSASNSASKKKCKAIDARAKNTSWGHGMACVGRRYSDLSNSFGSDFYGPIPGIEVGTTWRFRFQVSEAGVHTPLVAGIAGKESSGASSIVFSGTYIDDIDLGDEIYYTGSGGHGVTQFTGCRSSGNRPQVTDQTLKRANKALAMSCAAPFNPIAGSSAGHNWKSGKPIRVLRSGNSRCSKSKSSYCPNQGIRYDGIYKVVKYWPEKSSKTQLIVWRFHLRRDDQVPAPWTKDGKNRIRRLSLESIIEPANDPLATLVKAHSADDFQVSKLQFDPNTLPSKFMSLVEKDKANGKVWKSIFDSSSVSDQQAFIRLVGESFKCACCMDVAVNQPVTSECGHIFCRVSYTFCLSNLTQCSCFNFARTA